MNQWQSLSVVLGTIGTCLNAGVASSQEQPCAQVDCSGHGRCIETATGPACACHTGFAPDATGLNCMAEALPTAGHTDPAEAQTEVGRDDYERVKTALPQYSHEEDFLTYGRLIRAGRIQGTFIDYKLYRVGKRKAGGIAMLAIGATFIVSFFPVIAVGISDQSADDAECENSGGDACSFDTSDFMTLFFLPALGGLLIGTPLTVLGALRMKKTKEMKETLQSLNAIATNASFIQRFSIAPFYQERTSTLGLSGRFVF